jgi:hypothetical protein
MGNTTKAAPKEESKDEKPKPSGPPTFTRSNKPPTAKKDDGPSASASASSFGGFRSNQGSKQPESKPS